MTIKLHTELLVYIYIYVNVSLLTVGKKVFLYSVLRISFAIIYLSIIGLSFIARSGSKDQIYDKSKLPYIRRSGDRSLRAWGFYLIYKMFSCLTPSDQSKQTFTIM